MMNDITLSARTRNSSPIDGQRPIAPRTIAIGEIPLGDDIAKIGLASDDGARILTVWRWTEYRGKMKPGRLGVALPVRALPELANLINEALARARSEGFIDANPVKQVSGAARVLAGGCR